MCSPPLLLPELLKVIKHSEISEKKEKKTKQFYKNKLPNKILKSPRNPASCIKLILIASLHCKCINLEIF